MTKRTSYELNWFGRSTEVQHQHFIAMTLSTAVRNILGEIIDEGGDIASMTLTIKPNPEPGLSDVGSAVIDVLWEKR